MHLLDQGPPDARLTLVLAHGAGAPMDSPFMDTMANGLAAAGHRVVRFEFPYMAGRRDGGTKRPPDRQPVLLDCWRQVIADLGGPQNLVIGGKSMGGRMASLIADVAGVRGLVCLGYPFHPPGKPEKLRTEHLAGLRTPTLIVQGTRDTLGGRDLVAGLALSPAIRLHWAEDGDHSLKPRRASGRTEAQALAEAVSAIDAFLTTL
ncbi:MAG: alpha/beta fold hydrolase [Caenispirillum bisanense]|nr:alpha/beta fold hydrolase [Caenispirillum bisanense]MCA1971871.1 alpha/beta fold hydrolase [Caenispirillum sp.]